MVTSVHISVSHTSFYRNHPIVLFNILKVFYSVTKQNQYIVNNTSFWLHVSVSSNYPQANNYVPSYDKYWPEDGLMKRKHIAEICIIDYILMLCSDLIKYFMDVG